MIEKENIGSLEKVLLFLVIFSLIFLQRIAIPIGNLQLSPVFIFSFLLILVLFSINRIEIHQQRLIIFLLALVGVFISSVFALVHLKEVGISSLFSLVAFYIPFLFICRQKGMYAFIISAFQGSMIIVAVGGVIQFLLQVAGAGFIDPIQQIIPEALRLTGYMNQLPLFFGSPIMKSNGLFMLEPSFYSKFIATAIVIEFITKRRIVVLILFCIALLFSFSGTGFMILAIAAVPLLFRLKVVQICFLAILLVIPTYIFFDKGYGEVFIERLDEFNHPDTSGHVRFIAPWLTFNEFLTWESSGTILLGNGAGSLQEYHGREFAFDESSTVYKTSHANAYIKLFVEYGLVGGLFFCLFLIYVFLSNKQNKLLIFCLFFNYSFLTVSLLQPSTVYLCFILCMISTEQWEESVSFYKQNRKNSRLSIQQSIGNINFLLRRTT
ncbi:hypothetical protein [Peribacillus asahii]|uniref:hypothetical protein n=1 Tax=Peribacillus asahii TaxID=228899 RepID=UPI00207AAA9D|nr:hypothetical protein [Peribacillus asahii]USK68324.1 hypothetical protein LIS76_11835 [Peribacillus asahii]